MTSKKQAPVWSVSALKSIGTCGAQYEFRYQKVAAQSEDTPPLAFGRAVHRCLERLHKEGNLWAERDWQRMWNDEWYHYGTQVNWQGYRKSTYDKMGVTMLANYINTNRDAIVLESELAFPDEKGQVYKIGKHTVKGVIDQVRRLPNGKLLLVDFKTSKDVPDSLLLRADPQFTIYYSVIREKYGEEPLIGWYHLKTGELILTRRRDSDIKLVEQMLDEGQLRVDQSMFTRNIGYHCRYCVFKQQCLGDLDA